MNILVPRILKRGIAALLAAGALDQPARAVNGDWLLTAGGTWGAATNWSSNPTLPGATAGDVININSNIGAAASITLGANRTVGTLLLGDANTTHAFSLTGNTLILDQTGVDSALVRFGVAGSTAAVANTIASAIQLNDNARFYTTLSSGQVLSGTISGAFSITYDNNDGTTLAGPVTGQGQFLLSNAAANTYSLGTTIDDVRVQIQGNNAALGTGAVNILDGGQVFNNTGLTTIANTFNIAGNGWLESSGQFGALRLDSGAIVTGAVNLTANAAIGSNSGTGAVNGLIAGTGFNLNKRGAGILVLGGANTYSGGLSVAGTGAATAGFVQLNNNAAAGTGTITYTSGTTGRLAINGGVTIANAIDLSGTGLGFAGRGLVEQINTGLATVDGAIHIGAGSTLAGGGHFRGGTTAATALVLNGAITSAVNVFQREGFVRYGGGGAGFTSLTVTGTAQVGATDGISTAASVLLGDFAASNLDLNGFDQTLANLTFGVGAFNTSALLGTRTLTLAGNLATAGTGAHTITGTGTLALGANPAVLTIVDGASANDLSIAAIVSGSAGFTKAGAGTLILNGNVTNTGTLAVTAGALGGNTAISGPLTLATGTRLQGGAETSLGNISSTALTFGAGTTTVHLKIGPDGETITTGALVTNGTTFVQLRQLGGILANGTYPLIHYTGASPGLGGFAIGGGGVGHTTGAVVDTGTSIAYQITGNDRVLWTGAISTAWDPVSATQNWVTQVGAAATNFVLGDDVIFSDGPAGVVAISANVFPSNVTFTNTAATSYTFSGAGISGTTALTKTGNGSVTFSNANGYVGATTINAGTLTGVYTTTITPIASASNIAVAPGATYATTSANVDFTVTNVITGAGTVVLNANNGGTAGNRTLGISGSLAGFTGTLHLSPTAAGGTFRLLLDNVNHLGGAAVDVDDRGQLFNTVGGLTIPNSVTLTGNGFSETAGFLGALRSNTTTWTGAITIDTAAKIGAFAATATFTNAISGGMLTFGGSLTSANNETMIITGDAGGLTGLTVNDAAATAGAATILVHVGNGGAAGTLGSAPISLKGDGFKTAVIRFDRTDGYTLGGSVTSSSPIAANNVRTQLQVDVQGTGFNTNGETINLGTADATGGSFRVGNTRIDAVANINSALTAGSLQLGAVTGMNGATANLSSGANVNVNQVDIALNATGAAMNIAPGATLTTAGGFFVGQNANFSGTVDQVGGDVTVANRLQIGHASTETSTYTFSGGTVTLSGAAPGAFPFTTGPTEQGGGIYLGIDGTGSMTQSGGIVSTNFVVLDNRTETAAGANMPTGVDTYTLSGGTLILKSNHGIISRFNSTLLNLAGGTLRAATGVSPNLDVVRASVTGTTTVDTNGANAFNLHGPLTGAGTLNLIGGGSFTAQDGDLSATIPGGTGLGNGGSLGPVSFNLAAGNTLRTNRTLPDVWSGALSGEGNLEKLGAGTLTLSGPNTFTGGTIISGGTLKVNADAALGAGAGSVAINNKAVLQASGPITTSARSITLGLGGGTIDTNGQHVNLSAGSIVTGTTLNKIGAGVLTLAGTQTYAALIVVAGDVNLDSALGIGASIVDVNGRVNVSVDQTLASLAIGGDSVVTIGGPALTTEGASAPDFNAGFAPSVFESPAGALVGDGTAEAVPEPGSLGLLLTGGLGFLCRRGRRLSS